jgi:hypothetical protein
LFAVDPAEFVAARDDLARQLKADGQRDESAAVKALRRPPVPVWALNRVARDDGDVIEALLTAAADAREAQDALLAGDVDRDALREALAQRRKAMHHVVHRAGEIVEASGRSPSAQQREIESALNAIVASDELSELLRKGELVDVADEQADDDLSALLGASVSQGPTKKPRPVSNLADARAAKQAAAARKDLERAQKEESAAADALTKARESVTEADNELDDARTAVSRAEAKADAAHHAEQVATQVHEAAVVELQRAEEAAAGSGD